MALSVAVLVGETKNWVPEIVAKAKSLKVGPGFVDGVDIAPLCYPELRDRIVRILDTVEPEGGKLLLDGRGHKVDGYPNGFYVGPTIIDNTNVNMTSY